MLPWFLYLMTSLYPKEAISLCLLKLSITTKLSNDIWGPFCLLGSLKYLGKLLIPLSPRNIFRWKKLLNLEGPSVFVTRDRDMCFERSHIVLCNIHYIRRSWESAMPFWYVIWIPDFALCSCSFRIPNCWPRESKMQTVQVENTILSTNYPVKKVERSLEDGQAV